LLADDVGAFYNNGYYRTLTQTVNTELESIIAHWFSANKLSLNVE